MVDRAVELELDDVADLPAALGIEHVERIRVAASVGVLLEREEPDLGAVAVRDHQARALGHGTEQPCSCARRAQLIGGARRLAPAQQGVAAESDDGQGREGSGSAMT